MYTMRANLMGQRRFLCYGVSRASAFPAAFSGELQLSEMQQWGEYMNKNMKKTNRLNRQGTGLCIIDIQEAFSKAIPQFDTIVSRASILARAFSDMELPIVLTEQYPRGLGKTIPSIIEACETRAPLEKVTFSCCGADGFENFLIRHEITQMIICGIETHVCVNQTALDLLSQGMKVYLAVDAVGSRNHIDYMTALRRLELEGAFPVTVEMCLFELLQTASANEFKAIQKLVK